MRSLFYQNKIYWPLRRSKIVLRGIITCTERNLCGVSQRSIDDSSIWEGTNPEPLKIGDYYYLIYRILFILEKLKLSGTILLSLDINLSGKLIWNILTCIIIKNLPIIPQNNHYQEYCKKSASSSCGTSACLGGVEPLIDQSNLYHSNILKSSE